MASIALPRKGKGGAASGSASCLLRGHTQTLQLIAVLGTFSAWARCATFSLSPSLSRPPRTGCVLEFREERPCAGSSVEVEVRHSGG